MNRRDYLKLAGVGGAAATGSFLLFDSQDAVSNPDTFSEWGPSDRSEWTLEFQDRFHENELDREQWGIGWGWGWTTATSSTRITPSNVFVRDEQLILRGTKDGETPMSGGVNTKNIVSLNPGSYVEARINFARRNGFLNAFWANPTSEIWPPEIDIVELFQRGSDIAETRQSHHHLHYPKSGQPGDQSTHVSVDSKFEPGGNLTEEFHTYGLKWLEDRIVPYVDGQAVSEWTDDTILEALTAGAPFYLMLTLNIGNVGTPDWTEEWGEEMRIDWVRLWRHNPE